MARWSVYEFEAKGSASIWVATVPLRQLPDDYFEEHYGREDDEPFTRFSEDFGFGSYDHDSVDTNGDASGAKPLARLVGECSFSASYLHAVAAAAEGQGLGRSEFVFLLYDIDYLPEVTGVSRSEYMAFLGSFRYDSQAPSAFQLEGGTEPGAVPDHDGS